MKIILSILATYLVIHAQINAFARVPWPTTPESLAGTYAGVLIPVNQATGDISEDLLTANSFAIFSIGIGTTGFSTGGIVIFVESNAFTGTVTGLGIPDEQAIPMLVDGRSVFDVLTFDGEGVPIPNVKIFASGLIASTLETTNDFFGSSQSTLVGEANLSFSNNNFGIPSSISYEVNGFKQSDEVLPIGEPSVGG